MTTSREMILVGGVVKLLRDRDSWAGETHIQKAAFVAKELKGVPFESEFVLYKHGPFSFELSTSLVHMRARNLLRAVPNPGFGPTFEVNDGLWRALDVSADRYFERFERDIALVCDVLASRNVAALERIATAVYVNSAHPKANLEVRVRKLVELKPHIPEELARKAFEEVGLIH